MSKKTQPNQNDEIIKLGQALAKTFTFDDGTVIPDKNIYYHGLPDSEAEKLKASVEHVEGHDAIRLPAIHYGAGIAVLDQMANGGLDKGVSHVTKIPLTATRTMTVAVTGVTEGDDGESPEYGSSRVHVTTKHTGTRGSTGMAHAFESLAEMAAGHFGPAKESTN